MHVLIVIIINFLIQRWKNHKSTNISLLKEGMLLDSNVSKVRDKTHNVEACNINN